MGLARRATDSKVRKLEREGPLGTEVAARESIDTLGTSDARDTQPRIVKVESGGTATAIPRFTGRRLRELKTQEGTWVPRGSKQSVGTSDHGSEQPPEVDATFAGAGKPAGGGANGERGTVADEAMRPDRERKPLEREPWTWLRDETSAQGAGRSKPSRACETLRAERRRTRERSPGRGLLELMS
jgi:hypothetical protein